MNTGQVGPIVGHGLEDASVDGTDGESHSSDELIEDAEGGPVLYSDGLTLYAFPPQGGDTMSDVDT